MTMIGFTTSTTSAELVTDTFAYTATVDKVGQVTKFAHLAHLDALIATQGDGPFGAFLKIMLLIDSATYTGFDDMVDRAPEKMRYVWSDFIHKDEQTYDSTVFLIGYSELQSRFVGYRYDSENDFTPQACEGLTLVPTPWTNRPSPVEYARSARQVDRYGHVKAEAAEILAQWNGAPVLTAPRGHDEWRDLARLVRKSRALQEFERVPVAGKVIHTKIRRGTATSTVIHQFNDRGQELLDLVAGTDHPLAGRAACWCGSGRTAGECCEAALHGQVEKSEVTADALAPR